MVVNNQFDRFWRTLENESWANVAQSRCEKLLEIYQEELTAVIPAIGASTKYSLRGGNTYVNVIFLYFIFNTFVIMCVDG